MQQQSRYNPDYTPPISAIDEDTSDARSVMDWAAKRSLASSAFLEQAPRLQIFLGWRVSSCTFLAFFPGLRWLEIYGLAPMPRITTNSARALSGVHRLLLRRAREIDVKTLDIFLSQMPLVRELHLLLDRGASPISYDYISTGRPACALEHYRMKSVSACSLLPLRYCHETLRHLDIGIEEYDDPAARDALASRLESGGFRRLKSLRLDVRDRYIQEAVAMRLVAACRFVRALELRAFALPEAYDLFDAILRACPRGLQVLTIVATSSDEYELSGVRTLTRHIELAARGLPALQEVVLRSYVGTRGVAPLRAVCRQRRILYRFEEYE